MKTSTALDGYGDDREFGAEWDQFLLDDREQSEPVQPNFPKHIQPLGNISLHDAVFGSADFFESTSKSSSTGPANRRYN